MQSTSWQNTSAINVGRSTNVQLQGLDVGASGTFGIWVHNGSQHVTIDHCYVHDLGSGGVRIGDATVTEPATQDVILQDSLVTRGGAAFASGLNLK